jgi:hypothetical protein
MSAQDFWHKITGSFGDVNVTDLCLTQSGILSAYIHWDGLYYTTNNGDQWIRTNYQGYDPNAIESINDSIFITGVDDIKVSNDFGMTWYITADFGMYNTFYYDSLDQILYAGSNSIYNGISGIYTTSDFGYDWELLYSFPMIAFNQWIYALCVTKTNHVILTFVIYSWPYSSLWKFYKSSDQGQTWEIIIEGHLIYQIIEDTSLNVYALASNGLMVSEDEGETWITRNIPSSDFIASDYSGRIYIGNNNGLTFSTDKGITWFNIPNSGLQLGINDIVINENNRIYVATDHGVYFGEADSLVVSIKEIEPVETFTLSQNYPNPFNPSTKIKFTIPSVTLRQAQSDNWVTLKVYDILGNEIAILVNEEKQPGTYEVEFNPESSIKYPASGIYFYQLKTGTYIETKKMVLIK